MSEELVVETPRVVDGERFTMFGFGCLVIALDHAGRFASAGVFADHGAASVVFCEGFKQCEGRQDQKHTVRGNAPLHSFLPRSLRSTKARARRAEPQSTNI